MKKITILALHLGYGGVEKSIASLSNILIERYEVEIISVYQLYDEPAFYIDDRVKIKYLLDKDLSPNKDEIKQAIKSKNIVKLFKEGLKSLKILKLKKSKMIEAVKNIDSGIVISTRIEHNEILSEYGKESLITIAQEHTYHDENDRYIEDVAHSCRNINYFMPVSQMLTDFYDTSFKKMNKNPKTECKFIPHSLDDIPENTSDLNSNNLISVGRLSPEKGFLDLIDVYQIVSKERPNWKLNIIGDGVELEKIQSKIKKYDLDEKVILHGYKDKDYISKMLMNSSIYTMASLEESFGLVLIEAQSFGVPCIAFDSAKGACEIIHDTKNGYLISNRNKEEMARKIIELIDEQDTRCRMGKESRKNSLKYSKETVSNQWFEFIEQF